MELCKYLASHRKTNMVLFPLYEVSNSPIQTESRMAITWAEERGTGGVVSWVQSFRFAKWKDLEICFKLMWIYLLWTVLLKMVQLFSHVPLLATPWTAACQASLSITNSWSLLELMSIDSVMPSNHIILCRPLLLTSIFPSIRVFFPMSQLFTSGGQSIGVSASTSALLMNTQDWSPLEWTGWISLQSKGLSKVFYTTVQKHQFYCTQLSL